MRHLGFPSGSPVKNSPILWEPQETFNPWVRNILCTETHSSILAWKIPWTEEPGRLQSTKSKRVGHDWSILAQHIIRNLLITSDILMWTQIRLRIYRWFPLSNSTNYYTTCYNLKDQSRHINTKILKIFYRIH